MKSIAIVALILVGSAVLGATGWAQVPPEPGVPSALKPNKFFTIKGSISGTFSSTPATLSSGACAGGTAGFATQCPTGHTCFCDEAAGAKFSSTVIGKGTANVFITVDGTAGYGLPIPTNPNQRLICLPFVAEFDVTAKNDTEELEAVGGGCPSLPSNVNASQFAGAFGAEATTLFTGEAAPFILTAQPDGSFKMPFSGLAATFVGP